MSLTGKYSPLNLNCLGSFVQNQGLRINAEAVQHMGSSNSLSNYVLGTTTQNTVLRMLVWSIRAGFLNNNLTVYSNLISIGSTSIPVLGDSKPPQYTRTVTLNPYPNAIPYTSEYTSFGWLRIIPLQAHNEFYINNGSYSDFLFTFNMAHGFISQSNKAIDAMNAADKYLDGAYSNMNDLITADLSGVSLALFYWGQDLIASGRAIDLTNIDKFGSPLILLKTLYKNKALTKSVNLALLAAGFTSDEIESLILNTDATVEQQKKLYSAYCIVMGIDLVEVMIGLNCQTKGLRTLADLLDPKFLFPRSYATLTAPTYNATPGPTNSKTYYLIYTAGEVTSYVVNNYGENLKVILPATLASACDAFASTMVQIKNIKSMDIEKFSQVVQNLETVTDLGVNGTNVPTNQPIRNTTLPIIALGNGEKGRYTTCDFFGAMSGLSYDWKILEGYIKSLQTAKLFKIYSELYLAITWKQATFNVTTEQRAVETSPGSGVYTWQYRITGTTIVDPGGGYSRNGAPDPSGDYTFSDGTLANSGGVLLTCNPDRNSSNTPGTYGRIINLNIANSGSWVTYGSGGSSPTNPGIQYRLPAPPDTYISYPYTGGTNSPYGTAGWPGMNSVVQSLINDANTEIASIASNNPALTVTTNKLYNVFGKHMTLEQNARSLGLRQELYLPDLSTTVTEIYGFMESLNGYATQTEHWGPVQNLEAITDTTKVGGNSMIGSMRETRNAHRLGLTGAEQDNEVGIEKLALPRVNGEAYNGMPIVTGGPESILNPNTGNANTSPWTTLVPPSIDLINITPIVKSSIITPSQAIEEVILCNCDCWDNIM